MQDARLHELKMPSIAADAAEAHCLIEEHFKVHIKLLRQDKGGVIAATGVAATAIAAVKLAPKAIPIVKEKALEMAKSASDVAKVIIRKLSSLLEPCWNLLESVGPSKLCLFHLKFASAPIWLLGQQWSSVIARGRNLFASTQLIRLQFSSKEFEKPIANRKTGQDLLS